MAKKKRKVDVFAGKGSFLDMLRIRRDKIGDHIDSITGRKKKNPLKISSR